MSAPELVELNLQLQELIEKGYIQPSVSPWGAPIIFIKKKDGTVWMCINYEKSTKLPLRTVTHTLGSMTCLIKLEEPIYFEG